MSSTGLKQNNMNREIKFKRVFQHESTGAIHTKIWGKINFDGTSCMDFGSFQSPSQNNKSYPIDDLQFTGLLDKNKKEIYEGDLLLIPDEETEPILDDRSGPTYPIMHIAEVIFRDGSFGIKVKEKANVYNTDFYSSQFIRYLIGDDFSDFEIIGNIYDNPELLK